MADFISSIELLGDDAVTDALISKTISEFKDEEVTRIGSYAFAHCRELTVADFVAVASIGQYAFYYCSNLKALILRKTDDICVLEHSQAFAGHPNVFRVYVPSALIDTYVTATNWTALGGATFRALEDYTVDGTINGELDENKI